MSGGTGGAGPDYQSVEGDQAGGTTVQGARMTFLEHLGELSQRLKKCLYAFIAAFAVVSSLPDPILPFGGPHSLFGYNFLLLSLLYRAENAFIPNTSIFVTKITDPISIFINLSLVLSVIIAMPYIFIQLYGFIAPGLYQRERRAIRKYLFPFTGLFVTGGLFGLFVVFPIVMRILLIFFGAMNIERLVPLSDFVNLLLLVPTITGLAFTFPVFLIPLVEFKVLNVKQLSKARKWVYVVVALGVGIINPDPTFISSIPIIVPIYALFEITVLIAKRIENKRNKAALIANPPQP